MSDLSKNRENSGAINDGGKRISYGEGMATREPSDGKGRYDLITPFGLARLAKWYELGAQKYADRNWEKGMPFSRCIDSAKRHIDKYMMGMKDEDHLSAAVWNILSIIHFEELGMTELNDLPDYVKVEEKESIPDPLLFFSPMIYVTLSKQTKRKTVIIPYSFLMSSQGV